MEDMIRINTDGSRTYLFRNECGDAERRVYTVFNGVELIYDSVHTDVFHFHHTAKGGVIELHYCREGRMEHEADDGFFYLMPGDLSVEIKDASSAVCDFPLRHYHGITIVLDAEIASRCFSCFMEDADICPEQIARRLCGEKNCFVLRAGKRTEHIFAEMYSIPEDGRKGYFKIKIMQLLYMLKWLGPADNDISLSALPQTQVRLAKNAAAYLSQKMNQRITLEELAVLFNVSRAHLCNVFKGVYGVPVYTYMRIQKMQAAALQLLHSDRPIIEIAGECGYDNPSKFSAAFKEVMGETPAEYRKAHSASETGIE